MRTILIGKTEYLAIKPAIVPTARAVKSTLAVRYYRLVPLFYAALAIPREAGAPCKRPRVLRSSSMSGQWIPYPAPAMRQFARCSDVACSRRGYHAKGYGSSIKKINTDCVVSAVHVTDSLTCFRFQSSHSMPPIIPSGALK